MFRVNGLQFCILFVVLMVISTTIVEFYKLQVLSKSFQIPIGSVQSRNLQLQANKVGTEGLYIYNFRFEKSYLFNGKLQIIPDDCLEKVFLNGQEISNTILQKTDRCDTKNGFYLDILPYVKKGENSLRLDIKNIDGQYGVDIQDTTFYGKYVLFGVLILLLLILRWDNFFNALISYFYNLSNRNKTITWILICQIVMVISLTFITLLTVDNSISMVLLLIVLFLTPLSVIISSLLKSIKYGKVILIAICLAISIWILYVLIMPYNHYSYDHDGHLEYIKYIVNTGEIPIDSGGWSFYHPSFYYRTVAVLWKFSSINKAFNEEDLIKVIQGFSLLIFILYVYFSIRIIDILFKKLEKIYSKTNSNLQVIWITSIFIIIFWPANAMLSVRIGNDLFFYLFFAITMFFSLKWWFSSQNIHFIAALLFSAFNVWAKTNGMITLGIVGILLLFKFYYEHNTLLYNRNSYIFRFTIYAVIAIITCVFSFSSKITEFIHDNSTSLVVGNANLLGDDLLIENKINNFALFNPIDFIKISFTDSYDDKKGRKNFWFYLFKTSMFGEFNIESNSIQKLASGLSGLFLILLFITFLGIYASLKKIYVYIPLVVSLFVFIISMIIFRIDYPYASSNDFRYIFPSIISFSALIGVGLMNFFRTKIVLFPILIILHAFIICSVIYQLLVLANEIGL